jgi:hypothetical protein
MRLPLQPYKFVIACTTPLKRFTHAHTFNATISHLMFIQISSLILRSIGCHVNVAVHITNVVWKYHII